MRSEPFTERAVTAALQDAGVVSVEVVERFAGSSAEVARLRIGFSDGGSRTVIGKAAMGPGLAAARRERQFYEHLAPLWAHPAPALLGSMEDGAGDHTRVLLLTEDLEAAGYALPSGAAGAAGAASEAQLHAVIDTLVRLHVAFWDRLRADVVDWAHPAPSVTQAAQAWPPAVIAANARAVREAAADFEAEAALTRADRALVSELLDAWERQFLARVGPGRRLTLIHADFHLLGNVFFAADDPRPRVIDWSELKPGLGPHDLAYCLTPLPADDRRARDGALLRRYWEGLHAAGIDYPWALCEWDYRFSLITKLFQAVFQRSARWLRASAALIEELDGRRALREPPPVT
jgi:hypothetical protein